MAECETHFSLQKISPKWRVPCFEFSFCANINFCGTAECETHFSSQKRFPKNEEYRVLPSLLPYIEKVVFSPLHKKLPSPFEPYILLHNSNGDGRSRCIFALRTHAALNSDNCSYSRILRGSGVVRVYFGQRG